MNHSNRPKGRQKYVGSGTGSVKKRGSGIGGQTGGPVGFSGGYSDRPRASSSGKARNTGYSGSYSSSSRNSRGRNNNILSLLLRLLLGRGRPRNIIGIAILIIAAYFIFNNLGGSSDLLGGLFGENSSINGFLPVSSSSVQTYIDKGPYTPNKTVADSARDKYTVLKGNGKDKATIMVYLLGSDLETKAGMASSDLQEILKADISDNINIIIETGGARKWNNNAVSNKTNQRYRVTNKGLQLIEDNLGKKSMVDPETLSDFIIYCKNNYPADRYSLILWDHGGGSMRGFGYDEHFPGDNMTLDEIANALKNGNCTFDLIGFDACLMATLETAIVLEPHADYMIASEEVEPGIGWHYTGWISALSKNTSISTVDLGKILIDDYVKEVKTRVPKSQATLSLIDLAELKGTIPDSLTVFARSTNKLIDNDKYKIVSNARAGTKEFAPSSKINQIDLIHFAENLGTKEAKAFANDLRGCIKYNRTSTNINNSNGVSIYFPYGNTKQLNTMLDTYDKIGINEEYSDCIKSFASLTAGGQITALGSGNILDTLLNSVVDENQAPISFQSIGSDIIGELLDSFISSGDYSSLTGLVGDALGSWLDIGRMKSSVDYFAENHLDVSQISIVEKNGQRILRMPEKQWELVQFMEMNVFLDDGEGFIDLGLDNVYEFDEDGNLIMEYDGTWLSLNGQIVAYYMESDDSNEEIYSIKGRVPAMLNGQLVDIVVVFDNENPKGMVLGARIKYDAENETPTIAKGLIDIVKGDKIDFLCDYYTYNGEYSNTYYLNDEYTATGEWVIENLSVGDFNYQMTYRITDIYGNNYWTPSISH